jgi:hypothetical protein
VYSRELDGKTYTFGVSGKLWRDALLMYDHQTRSLWSHITGEAVRGELKGKKLKMLASMPQISWKTWRTNYPDTKVLSVQLDLRNPERRMEERRGDSYARYHASSDTGISGMPYTDNRLRNKDLVVGVKFGELYRAYPFEVFEHRPILNDEIDGEPVLVFHDKLSSATAVFKRALDDKPLTFEHHKGYFAKDSSGSTWNLITGVATDGKLEGKTLERLPAINVYWFAWARYHPETTIYGR